MDRYDALQNKLLQPNAHNLGVIKTIEGYYPAFAVKILEKNPLVEALVTHNLCNMDILNYPVCSSCETLALWNRYIENPDGSIGREGKCWKCGVESPNPITLEDFCMMELKKKAPETVGEELRFAVDLIAQRYLADADRIYKKSLKEKVNV